MTQFDAEWLAASRQRVFGAGSAERRAAATAAFHERAADALERVGRTADAATARRLAERVREGSNR